MTSRGTATPTATSSTAPAVDTPTCLSLRRLARFLICSNAPCGGSNGFTGSPSQASTRSLSSPCGGPPWPVPLRSATGFPQRRAQPGPRLEQVGLDRPLRPAEQAGHLPDGQASVVIQQERLAQPVGQCRDQRAHVHVLDRVLHVIGRDGADGAQRTPLAASF